MDRDDNKPQGIQEEFDRVPTRATFSGGSFTVAIIVVCGLVGFLCWWFLIPESATTGVQSDRAEPRYRPIPAAELAEKNSGTDQKEKSLIEVGTPSPSVSMEEAREAIHDFLGAPTWQERLAYIYGGEVLRDEIADYYSSHPDGPVTDFHLKYLLKDENPGDGDFPLMVFFLSIEDRVGDFPITIRYTAEGPKVDWDSFIEFKDREFGRYLDSGVEESRVFRVVLERQSYWGADRAEMGKFTSYQVESPDPDCSTMAFVARDTPVAEVSDKYFSWGAGPIATTIELERHSLPHGESHYIIKRLVTDPEASDGWHLEPGSGG